MARGPRLVGNALRDRAAAIRSRIEATVVRRAPQVMEDELGNLERGNGAVRDLAEGWRFGGSFIGETSDRRAAEDHRLLKPRSARRHGAALEATRAQAQRAWLQVAASLAGSD